MEPGPSRKRKRQEDTLARKRQHRNDEGSEEGQSTDNGSDYADMEIDIYVEATALDLSIYSKLAISYSHLLFIFVYMELDGLFMTCLCWWGFVPQSCSSGTGRVCSFILSPGLVCWVHPLSPQVDSQLISSQPVGWNQKLALLILGLAFSMVKGQ